MNHKNFAWHFYKADRWHWRIIVCRSQGVTYFGTSVHKTIWREHFSNDTPCKVEFKVTHEHVRCKLKGISFWNTKRPWKKSAFTIQCIATKIQIGLRTFFKLWLFRANVLSWWSEAEWSLMWIFFWTEGCFNF